MDPTTATVSTVPAGKLSIAYPQSGAVFPRNITAPKLRWKDETAGVDRWRVVAMLGDDATLVAGTTTNPELRLSPAVWKTIVDRSQDGETQLIVEGSSLQRAGILSRSSVAVHISPDEVRAPIFFRDVPLPFSRARNNVHQIRWRLGRVDRREPPRVVLEKIHSCANCHSFSHDGSTFGMNVGFGDAMGTFTVSPVEPETRIDDETTVRWTDLRKDDPSYQTAAFLNAISPDGRYVVAGAEDRSMVFTVDDVEFSFVFFFTYRGILAVYDTETKEFWPLPGADDRRYVQTNPTFSPDGEFLVFARAEALTIPEAKDTVMFRDREVIERIIEQAGGVRYDLYRMPFNEGRGGPAVPLEGASDNGMSNYFPKVSPDGRWVVFTRAKQFNLLQPDSRLYIVPATGGKAREMSCNTPNFNSWHSLSPDGRWLVFASKAHGPYTQLMLTHLDAAGGDAPAVLLEDFVMHERAANIPEFANIGPGQLQSMVHRLHLDKR